MGQTGTPVCPVAHLWTGHDPYGRTLDAFRVMQHSRCTARVTAWVALAGGDSGMSKRTPGNGPDFAKRDVTD